MNAPRVNIEPALKRRRSRRGANVTVKPINLALQGGGAHGAFTWGVLDRLLDDERVSFDGTVATSAGAMNAAVMAYGLAEGGREGAKTALAGFWRRISQAAGTGPLQPSLFDRMANNRSLQFSPVFMWFDIVSRLMSPYQFNPLNINPLRRALEQSVDFEVIHRKADLKLFVCATNVRSGKIKVFDHTELSLDAVMASACLPNLFQAVEIDGEAYWDGGYMGNPAIYPLIYNCDSRDVLVVHVNPMYRHEVPTSASEIINRINEISFNSSLMREMRAIAFVTRLIDENAASSSRLKRMLIHSISADDVMADLSASSKLNADWSFLTSLFEAGREHAAGWLERNFDALGERSTVDIQTYL